MPGAATSLAGMPSSPSTPAQPDLDVLIVGAGMAGLYALHRLRSDGYNVLVVDRAPEIGGTWQANRYPGVRCDIESVDYCFSFSDEVLATWRWSERYAQGAEIRAYLRHVADVHDLRRSIELSVTVTGATWDSAQACWSIATDTHGTLTARYLVLAVGNLSIPYLPQIDGLESFAGTLAHTSNWPADLDVAGQRVGVIGTGSSGIQTITAIAPRVEHLTVFQRTPNYSMPAHNHPLSDDEYAQIMAGFRQRRHDCEWSDAGTPLPLPERAAVDVTEAERQAAYDEGWAMGGISALSFAFNDMFRSETSNRYAQDYARARIREKVADPATAELLCPSHHIGTRRTCVDTGYYEVYNLPHVELVDVTADPIVCVEPSGVRTLSGLHELDVLVVATGFDAIAGAFAALGVTGATGQRLSDEWTSGPGAYLGLVAAGFPNMFLITGPGSPSVLSNMAVSIEQHVDLTAELIGRAEAHGGVIDADPEAQTAWMTHVTELVASTLYPQARSWYVGANVPGKPRTFPVYIAGCGPYRAECESVLADDTRGFIFARREGQ